MGAIFNQENIFTAVIVTMCMFAVTSSSYICSRKWRHVLDTDMFGTEFFGSKAALTKAAMEGAPLRIFLGFYRGTSLVINEDKVAFLTSDNICIESLKHIVKDNWKTFHNESTWQFFQICTTGDMQTYYWRFGSNATMASVREKVGVSWYAKYNGCAEGEGNMLLTSYGNGTTDGSMDELVSAVSDGAGLTVYDFFTAKRLTMMSVNWNTNLIVGHNQWAFSDHLSGDHLEFDSLPTWLFSLWTSGGVYKDLHWKLVDNTISRVNYTADLKWYADPCWHLAYSHDEDGNPLDGSLAYLRASVSKGHRVKIITGNFSAEVERVIIQGDHVTGVITSDVSHSRYHLDDFGEDVYWLFRILSTTGMNKIFGLNILSPTVHGVFHRRRTTFWYVDTRPWKKMFSVNEQGGSSSGSKHDLLLAAMNGADVRLAWRGSQYTSFLKVDSVIMNGTEMAFEVVRSLEVKQDARDGFILAYHPAWLTSLSTTEGELAWSMFTVGQHRDAGSGRTNFAMDFFVNT